MVTDAMDDDGGCGCARRSVRRTADGQTDGRMADGRTDRMDDRRMTGVRAMTVRMDGDVRRMVTDG